MCGRLQEVGHVQALRIFLEASLGSLACIQWLWGRLKAKKEVKSMTSKPKESMSYPAQDGEIAFEVEPKPTQHKLYTSYSSGEDLHLT